MADGTSHKILAALLAVGLFTEVSLNYCSQNGGNLYRAPYYNRNLNIGPRIDSSLGQSPHVCWGVFGHSHAFIIAIQQPSMSHSGYSESLP